MALRTISSAFQQRTSSVSSQASNLSCAIVAGAAFDTLAVAGIASMVLTVGSMELTLLPLGHLVLSCCRSAIVLAYVAFPHWFTHVRTLELFYCSTIVSAALFIGCASTILLETANSQENAEENVGLADHDSMYGKMAALTPYSMINAMVSCSLFVSRRTRDSWQDRTRARESWRRESDYAPADSLTLKDVTLRTLVFDGCAATADHVVDASDHENCCICLCPLFSGEVVSELTCHHRYHKACLEIWEESQRRHGRSDFCPLRCKLRSVAEVESAHVYQAQSGSTSVVFV
eukprot:TRINITY_DN16089_c1_g1_i1.p1 TRINITY_DN16089_c1_g1~~TRINITY_DN16089_c1_g1_i1.p1  ORF type:complete len:290 (+),score=13.24 TRINITY_DN16089_c1_g1_i1:71-940(+)